MKSSKVIKEMVKEYAARERRNIAYFKSTRFTEVITQLQKHLKQADRVQDDVYTDLPVFGDVYNTEFMKLFDSLFCHALPKPLKVREDKGNIFPRSHIIYKGIKFEMVFGQGTALFATKASS